MITLGSVVDLRICFMRLLDVTSNSFGNDVADARREDQVRG